jgi:hypothetical protein
MSTSLQNISVKYMDLLSEIETGQENTIISEEICLEHKKIQQNY